MKTSVRHQHPQRGYYSALVITSFLLLGIISSCDMGFDLDWDNWDPCASAPTIKGVYRVSDSCSPSPDNTEYSITIEGTCPNFTISNLFEMSNEPKISMTYVYYMPDQLSIPEQNYADRTIYGSGSIDGGSLTLDINLRNGGYTESCIVYGDIK